MIVAAVALLLNLSAPQTAVPYRWKNVEIVGGGFVTGIIPHPKAKDVVYARTDIGGAYRWNPVTARWVPIQDFIKRSDWNLYGAESVALDPNDPNRVYIAAGTYTNEWGGNGAILRSRNKGDTWDRIDLPFKNGGNEDGRSMGERLVVDPNQGKVLFFGTRHNGLMQSEDYGSTWKQSAGFPITGANNSLGVSWVLFDPSSSKKGSPCQTVYAGGTGKDQNLYRSTDAGKTWLPVPGQPAKLWPHQAKLQSNGKIVLAYCDTAGPNGVSNGAVFQYNPKNGKFANLTPEVPGPGNTFGYGGIAIDPTNPSIIMTSTLCRWAKHDTVFRSTDGGITWMNLSDKARRDSTKAPYLNWGRKEPEFGHWIGDVEIDPFNPNRAWYVTGATIWSTDNLQDADKGRPTTWIPRAEGLEETAVLDLISPPEGAHVISALGDIAGFAHFDLTKSPSGGMWTNPLWNTTYDIDYAGRKPLSVIRVGNNQAALSKDGGKTWKSCFYYGGSGHNTVHSGAISADGRVIVIQSMGAATFWTDDEGETINQSLGTPANGRVIADRINPNFFYIHDGKTGTLWFSKDAARSFTMVTNKYVSGRGRIYPSPAVEGEVWIPLDKGLACIRVKESETKLYSPEIYFEQVAFGKAAPGKSHPTAYIIGKVKGIEGLFRSIDECVSWQRINDDKTQFGTGERIEGDPRIFGRVYLGTNGRGILYGDIK